MEIIKAEEQHMDMVRELFREYQVWLDADVCFQDFEEELANLPGHYSAPKGIIYLAFDDKKAIACSAIKPCKDKPKTYAELKRLYVQESYRGKGLGKKVFDTSMQGAKEMGYEAVILETLPEKMKAAQFLYREYGFQAMPDYLGNADQGVECLSYRFKNNA